ncbi:MAG: hypothetical protein KKF27_20490 [Gammaproteobacteria bacterium]|nr:hypothetical protein [Gammaproteobacteria bacterium]
MALEIKSIDEIVALALKVIGMIWPEQIEKIKVEIEKREKEIEKDDQEFLKALNSDPVDFDAINRLWSKRPRL